jgi:6-phospho-beta-glucosidase
MLQYIANNQIDWRALDYELDEIRAQKNDFISFSYYASSTISSDNIMLDTPPNMYLDYGKVDNPYIETTEWNWQIDPIGFRDVLNKIYQRYHLPVFPIENGVGVQEQWDGKNPIQDDYRINYHRRHIQELLNARDIDGVEILGYLGWGLIDILSSQGDMRKRYGLVYVNRTNHDLLDMKRVPKKSYTWFKNIIATNGQAVWEN